MTRTVQAASSLLPLVMSKFLTAPQARNLVYHREDVFIVQLLLTRGPTDAAGPQFLPCRTPPHHHLQWDTREPISEQHATADSLQLAMASCALNAIHQSVSMVAIRNSPN